MSATRGHRPGVSLTLGLVCADHATDTRGRGAAWNQRSRFCAKAGSAARTVAILHPSSRFGATVMRRFSRLGA